MPSGGAGARPSLRRPREAAAGSGEAAGEQAALQASRYVFRERRGSSDSRPWAACSSSSGASRPRLLREGDLGAQQIDTRAAELVERPGLRGRQELRAASNCPAPRLAWAAASDRSAFRAGSPVSATERFRNAAAAARPPRAWARPAETSSSSATSSTGPVAATARCQARRSGSASRSVDLGEGEVGDPALRRHRRIGRRPTAQGDGERSRAPRPRAARRLSRRRRAGSRAARRHAAGSAGRRAAPPRRRAGGVAPARGASRTAGRSCSRCVRRDREPRAFRTRPRAASESSHGAAPAGRADSPRLGDDPVADALVELELEPRVQQRPGVAVDSPRTSSSGTCQHLARFPRREDEPHRFGEQAAGDEGERLRRGLIEPLRVVDDAQQRASLGRLGEEAEGREPDQEPVRSRPALIPKTMRSASR